MLFGLQSADTLENLSRLASKPGVQSTLLLSKSDHSIISSSGLLANSASSGSQDLTVGGGKNQDGSEDLAGELIVGGGEYSGNMNVEAKGNSAREVATMVFAFVANAQNFAEGMDRSDEVKLLRLRTRKNEIVIYPGSNFSLRHFERPN